MNLSFITAVVCLAFLGVSFCNGQSLPPCFVSMGDWGSSDPNTAAIGKNINDVAAHPSNYGCSSVEFVFALGDNFYNSGVDSINDPMWNSTFVAQFRSQSALQNMTFYAMVGDHDYGCENPSLPPNHTRAQAQVQYHYKVDSLWYLPSTNYTFKTSFGNGVTVLFVVLDMQAVWTCLESPPEWCFLPDQTTWLDQILTQADNDPTISAVAITGHQSIVCPNGGHFDPKIDNLLVPLGRNHRVSLFLTGHAHYLAWSMESSLGSAFPGGEMWYIVNGAGRGAGAYQCLGYWPPGTGGDVALPVNTYCCTNVQAQDGMFVIHRVHPSGFEHCAVDSTSGGGSVGPCQTTSFRSQT